MREDVFRRERFAVTRRDVDGAHVSGGIRDVQVLPARVAANFCLDVVAARQDDAVAFLQVEVKDVARFVPACRIVAVQQVGEGIRARTAFEQRCAVSGNQHIVARAAVQFVANTVFVRREQFGAVFA